MNNLQQRLIDNLTAHAIPARWSGDCEIIDADGHHATAWEFVELGDTAKGVNDFALLTFDNPENLEGCALETPAGLEGNKQKYRKAFEIAIGLYYATIGGAKDYSPETNALLNNWAKHYGGLENV